MPCFASASDSAAPANTELFAPVKLRPALAHAPAGRLAPTSDGPHRLVSAALPVAPEASQFDAETPEAVLPEMAVRSPATALLAQLRNVKSHFKIFPFILSLSKVHKLSNLLRCPVHISRTCALIFKDGKDWDVNKGEGWIMELGDGQSSWEQGLPL